MLLKNRYNKEKEEYEVNSEDKEFRPSHNSGENIFPNEEFSIFRKKRTLQKFCHLLVQCYEEKRSSAFYLIWDNLDLVSAETIAGIVSKKTSESKLFWRAEFFGILRERMILERERELEEKMKLEKKNEVAEEENEIEKIKRGGRFGNPRRRRFRRMQKGRKKMKFGRRKMEQEKEDKEDLDLKLGSVSRKKAQQVGYIETQQEEIIPTNPRVSDIDHQIYVESEFTSPGESNFSSRREHIIPSPKRRVDSGNVNHLRGQSGLDAVRESQEYLMEKNSEVKIETVNSDFQDDIQEPRIRINSMEQRPPRNIDIREKSKEPEVRSHMTAAIHEEIIDNRENIEITGAGTSGYTAGEMTSNPLKQMPTFGAQTNNKLKKRGERFDNKTPNDSSNSDNQPNSFELKNMPTFGNQLNASNNQKSEIPRLSPMHTFGMGKKNLSKPQDRLNIPKYSDDENLDIYSKNSSVSREGLLQKKFDDSSLNKSGASEGRERFMNVQKKSTGKIKI